MSNAQSGSISNPGQQQHQQQTPSAQEQTQSTNPRYAEEQALKDRTLTEFMLMLDDYEPMVRALFQFVNDRAYLHDIRSQMK